MVPVRIVHFSYLLASGYVASHSVSRGIVAKGQLSSNCKRLTPSSQGAASDYQHSPTSSLSPTKAFFDTLVWQGLASVVIPGLVINRTCALSRLILHGLFQKQLNRSMQKWMATGIGLGSIPFIIHPIDK